LGLLRVVGAAIQVPVGALPRGPGGVVREGRVPGRVGPAARLRLSPELAQLRRAVVDRLCPARRAGVARPECDVACLELVADGQGTLPDESLGEVLDPEARGAYRARLADLEDDLEQARQQHDEAATAAAQSELEALRRELAGSLGLGGRSRAMTSAAERARQSVTKALRGAVRRIAEEHRVQVEREEVRSIPEGP